MEILTSFSNLLFHFIDMLLHLDKYLSIVVQDYGMLTYLILFLIIFAETGFVVTPFLPGDSLLFASGAFAALGIFDIKLLLVVLMVAAVLGDSANYEIGKFLGVKIYDKPNKFIKLEHLQKTASFYEKYGAITIVIARFMPIIRTFAPFVAGIGGMHYMKFISYNIIGGITWVAVCTIAGYFFGNLPIVKNNFSLVIIGIIFISLIPIVVGFLKEKFNRRKSMDEN